MKNQIRSTEWINRKKIIQKHISDKNIENNTQAPKISTAANNRYTAEVIQEENKLQTENQPIKNKAGNFFKIMDSVRRFICFKELLAEKLYDPYVLIITIPFGNNNKARNLLKLHDISNPSKILLHVEISDIENKLQEDFAYELKLLAEEYKEKFKYKVFSSDITPRKDQYHQDVEIINHNLNSLLANSHIKRAKHSNIKSQHLHDDRRLKRNRNQEEAMSGVQLFCKNIYETMTQKQ